MKGTLDSFGTSRRQAVRAQISLDTRLPSSIPCVATLNERGRMAHRVLESMRGGQPLSAIAKRVAARYPTRFRTWQDALSRVGDLSVEYGE